MTYISVLLAGTWSHDRIWLQSHGVMSSSFWVAMRFTVTPILEEGKQVYLEAADLSASTVFQVFAKKVLGSSRHVNVNYFEGLIFIAEFWMKNT